MSVSLATERTGGPPHGLHRSRVAEVILAAVRPRALLAGKVIGIGGRVTVRGILRP